MKHVAKIIAIVVADRPVRRSCNIKRVRRPRELYGAPLPIWRPGEWPRRDDRKNSRRTS